MYLIRYIIIFLYFVKKFVTKYVIETVSKYATRRPHPPTTHYTTTCHRPFERRTKELKAPHSIVSSQKSRSWVKSSDPLSTFTMGTCETLLEFSSGSKISGGDLLVRIDEQTLIGKGDTRKNSTPRNEKKLISLSSLSSESDIDDGDVINEDLFKNWSKLFNSGHYT